MTEHHGTDPGCERVDELAGAIALGALDPDELVAVSAHLETCDQPHDEIRELLGADRALAVVVEPREPSPELRDRVMASVGAGAKASSRGRRGSTSVGRPRWLEWSSVGLWRGLAAAAAVVVLLVGLWNLSLQSQIATRDAALSAVADAISGGAPAYPVTGAAGTGYVIDTEGPGATFLVAGLESLPVGDLYEMWLIDAGGTALAVGTIDRSNPDLVVATLEQDLVGFAVFAVTVEPERVEAPTSEPVMAGTLTN